jgi:hypothetical protein
MAAPKQNNTIPASNRLRPRNRRYAGLWTVCFAGSTEELLILSRVDGGEVDIEQLKRLQRRIRSKKS